jgi:integrase
MVVHLALNSGLRVSKLAKLKIEDLKLTGKDNFLIVQKDKGSKNGLNKKRDVYLDKTVDYLG